MSDPPVQPPANGVRLRVALPVLIAVAVVCGVAGGFAASYLHPGPPGARGVRGVSGPQGPQGSPGIQGPAGTVATLPPATPRPITTIVAYNGNSNTPEQGFPIATGAIYAISYTVKATGSCQFYFELDFPDGGTGNVVAPYMTVARTYSGVDRVYLAPGNYGLDPGAENTENFCTWVVSVTTT